MSFFLSNFAWIRKSTAAIPFETIIFVLFMFVLVAVPLTILGAINGKKQDFDENSNEIDHKEKKGRLIPRLPIYLRPQILIIAAGLLPFQYSLF